jgi:hypothetical protein
MSDPHNTIGDGGGGCIEGVRDISPRPIFKGDGGTGCISTDHVIGDGGSNG